MNNIEDLSAKRAAMRKKGGALSALSDDSLALQFAETRADTLRYVATRGQWFSWVGTHWRQDDTLHAFDSVRSLCRDVAVKAGDGDRRITSGRTIAAVASLARSDRRLAAVADQWDADPWLLNTPSGTICLKTGECREHRAEDFITRCTSVAPAEGNCPQWRTFLSRVLDEDDQLIGFVQRMLGYALTGVTTEHALFFLHGLGANGKSVMLNTVIGILGEYHRAAPMEMFLASKVERHPTELAGLAGRRRT